jgi:hypothetical protein
MCNVFGRIGANEGMIWLIKEIEDLEREIRMLGGKPMPRPPKIHELITHIKRIF